MDLTSNFILVSSNDIAILYASWLHCNNSQRVEGPKYLPTPDEILEQKLCNVIINQAHAIKSISQTVHE